MNEYTRDFGDFYIEIKRLDSSSSQSEYFVRPQNRSSNYYKKQSHNQELGN